MDLTLVLCLILPMAMSLPVDDRDGVPEVGLDIEAYANGAKIDTEHEIPDGEDPLMDAHEKGDQYEGDMALTQEQIEVMESGNETRMLEMRQAMGHSWPKNELGHLIVPYTINAAEFSSSEQANIARAFEEYEGHTCVRIMPRTTETDYIEVIRGSGCWSYVGKQGGKQQLSLKQGCAYDVGTPAHEFMHAIGYKHEQSRSDRDAWVEIKWDNIKAGKEHNFKKCEGCDLQGLPYDIGSLMHYHAWAFAKDRSQPTILAKNGASLNAIGQANGFSESDLEGINMLHCKGTCYVDERDTEDCKRWADAHCNGEQYGDWMKKNCAKTCGVCKPPCKNIQTEENCKKWADYHCNGEQWGDWMKKNCAKTCGACS